MKEHLATVLVTLLVFGAGLGTGVLTQKVKPLPPPPLPVMGEFRQAQALPPFPPQNMEAVRERVEALKPQIEAFQQKLKAIEDECRAGLEAVLTPAQKEKLAALHQPGPGAARPQAQPPAAGPGREPRMPPGRSGPMGPSASPGAELVPIVIFKPMLEHLTKSLDLTADQQAKVEKCLSTRRDRVLELVDKTPPPSLELGRMMGPPGSAARQPGRMGRGPGPMNREAGPMNRGPGPMNRPPRPGGPPPAPEQPGAGGPQAPQPPPPPEAEGQ